MTNNILTSLRPFALLAWACLPLTMNAQTAPDKILFDFTNSTPVSAWQVVNDAVMGGISASRFQYSTNGTAIFSGEVSLENNGDFKWPAVWA